MSNGTDDTFCSPEPISVAEPGEDVGRGTIVEAGSDRASSALLFDQASVDLGPASEWDSYVDSQVRNDWVDLNHDERAFCDEYLDNGYKHREAAESVGRPSGTGIRLLNKPLCREYIHNQESKRRARRIVSERFFDAQLAELYDQAIGEVEIPIVTGSGMELRAKKHNGSLALSIVQERAKMSGVTKPDEVATGGVNVIIDVGSLLGKTKEINEI